MKFDKNLHVADIDGEHYDDKLKVAFTAKVPTQLFNAMKRMGWSPTLDTPVMHVKQLKSLSKWKVFQKGGTYITFWVTDDSKMGVAVSLDGKSVAMANTIKYDLNAIKRLVKNVEKRMSEDINEGKKSFPPLNKWWEYDPKDIVSAAYWFKGQLPPSGKKWDEAWENIKNQLMKKFPPPKNYKESLDEAKKGWHLVHDEDFEMEDGSYTKFYWIFNGTSEVGRLEDAREFNGSIDLRSYSKDPSQFVDLTKMAGNLSAEKVFAKFIKTAKGKKWTQANTFESIDEAKRRNGRLVPNQNDFPFRKAKWKTTGKEFDDFIKDTDSKRTKLSYDEFTGKDKQAWTVTYSYGAGRGGQRTTTRTLLMNKNAKLKDVEKVWNMKHKNKKFVGATMNEAKRLNPDSLVVSLKDFNKFTLVLGVQYDDITSIRMGEVDAPKDIINDTLKPLKIPAMLKKTGRGRYDLTFRNNKEMEMAYSAFYKKGYKVTNKTLGDPKTVTKIKSKLPLHEAAKFEIGPYQRTHGKAPKGHGMWAFTVEPQTDPGDDRYWFFSKPSNLTAAKKEAQKHFKDATHIYIMP